MIRKVDISHKTIVFITVFLGALWLIYQIKDVILLLFISIILMSALSPFIERLMRWKIPKVLAIAIVYVIVIGIISALLAIIITPLVQETANLSSALPSAIEKVLPSGNANRNLVEQRLSDFFGNVPNILISFFTNFITIISIAVLTFYLLLDKQRFENLAASLFVNQQERAKNLIKKIEEKLGAWLRGQMVLSIVIGVLCYILLFLFDIQYALPLAILAGVMEVVPVIGPIVSAIPAIFIAYLISPTLALFIGIGYLAIQQLENHIIVPQVMKKAVGLNPLIVILAITIGGKLLGIAGALLAVPITVVIQVLAEDFLNVNLDAYSKEDKKN